MEQTSKAAISFCRDPRSSRISTRDHIVVRAAITKLLRAKKQNLVQSGCFNTV